MADYEKWDEYYDGGFATGEPFNSSWEEYYSILHLQKYTGKKARSRRIAENALILADFKCEIDEEHFTFIRKKQNVPYTEAHHLVPLAYSNQFRYSLDVEENIVSLCSSCHKRIHYGKDAKELIRRLFSNRKELLKEAGIIISEEELFNMYGIY